jgi:signal peptide peptidase SppA
MATLLVSPPKDNRFRAVADLELVQGADEAHATLVGSFGPFNQWVEINSLIEGHFMERFAAGCFAKNFREGRDRMRCLFRHGRDPQLGDKVLGKIRDLVEGEESAHYEVALFRGLEQEAPLLMEGLRAGEYGSSHRFGVAKQQFVARPPRSAHNPDGLPECTVTEAFVRDFGPCTFPVYKGMEASIRSATDDWVRERFADEDQPKGNATAYFSESARPRMQVDEQPGRDEPSERLYARTIERIGATPWAIHPDALATILGIVSDRAAGKRLSEEEIRELIGTREEQSAPATSPVAVLALKGPIVPHAGLFSEVSGATAIEAFQTQFRDALASEDVRAIVLNIDSPGGEVGLVPELGAEILAARGEKPIVAVANTFAASAAYWIASAADELIVTPSGKVGSIGVLRAHEDISALQEKAGVKTTLIHAGEHKVDGNPFEPLSSDAEAEMQAHVDEYYAMFVDAVAKGRGVTATKVKADFGQGRMVMASKALEAGMVDKIATYDATLARLTKTAATKSRAEPTEPEPPAATTPDKTTPEPSEATTRSHAQTKRAGSALPRKDAESLTPEKERLP